MEPEIKEFSVNQKEKQLIKEISELELASKQLGPTSKRTLGLGCPGIILITLSSLALLFFNQTLSKIYLLIIAIFWIIGLALLLLIPSRGLKKEALAKENTQAKETLVQLQKKRDELSKLRKEVKNS